MTTIAPTHALTVFRVPGHGAEDVLVADDGTVYTATEDGAVHAVDPAGGVRTIGRTPGRPLGLEHLPDGRLLVCAADAGLLAMDPDTGRVETLATAVDGKPMLVCNNAAVGADGTIWFSDSSQAYPLARWKADFVEGTRTGRLIRRDPDGTLTVLIEGLAFANGVALAPDESFVAVAESGGRTVVRLWLAGERAGERDLLVQDLPGYPDNIALGSDGLIWVTIASPYDAVVDRLQRAPMLVRRLVTRLPEAVQPKPQRTARAQAYDVEGRLVHDVRADATHFHMATGVREHHGRLWFGSLVEPAIAVTDL